jgi:hypothetical protein
MAKIVLNPAIQVLSGDIGGLVYRQQADGSIIVAKAALRDPDYQPSPAQAAQMQRFKEASARYTRLMEDAGVEAAYEDVLARAGKGTRLRALVIGDILGAPKIDVLDLSGYHGDPGQPIRVLAEDSVGVSRLELVILDATTQAEVERGSYDLTGRVQGAVEWVYTATQDAPADHAVEVQVIAYDLAGNRVEQTQTA